MSSDLSQKNRIKQSNLICRTKSLLRSKFKRSARDQDFCADFSKDWLSMPKGIHCCRHDGPCDSMQWTTVSPSKKSMGFFAAAVP